MPTPQNNSPKGEKKKHEHRFWPNTRHKSDTCLICGYNPKGVEREKK